LCLMGRTSSYWVCFWWLLMFDISASGSLGTVLMGSIYEIVIHKYGVRKPLELVMISEDCRKYVEIRPWMTEIYLRVWISVDRMFTGSSYHHLAGCVDHGTIRWSLWPRDSIMTS
jgi:hypothetical protein